MSYPEEVPVGIIIEPVMHHNVPGAVVVGKGGGVPPVLIIEKITQIYTHSFLMQVWWVGKPFIW